MSESLSTSSTWMHKVLVGADMLAGLVIYLPYDVTISSYAGLVRDHGLKVDNPEFWIALANILDRLQANHVRDAIIADMQRARDILVVMHNLGIAVPGVTILDLVE